MHEDDVTALERRLAGWHPATAGLNADAMLYAAGAATGRRGRNLALAACGVLALLALALGVWTASERAERQALARRLDERPPAVAPPWEPSEDPSPGGYLSQRRLLEDDPTRWFAVQYVGELPAAAPPGPAIFRLGQRDRLIDP